MRRPSLIMIKMYRVGTHLDTSNRADAMNGAYEPPLFLLIPVTRDDENHSKIRFVGNKWLYQTLSKA